MSLWATNKKNYIFVYRLRVNYSFSLVVLIAAFNLCLRNKTIGNSKSENVMKIEQILPFSAMSALSNVKAVFTLQPRA